MKNIRWIAIGLIAMCIISLPFAGTSSAYELFLEPTSDGTIAKTQFMPGDDLFLNIVVDNPAGIAGCAFTLNYDNTVLTAPATTDGIPDTAGEITSIFPFSFDSNETHRENSTESNKIYFSGATIDPADGGPKYDAGSNLVLFTIKFTVLSKLGETGISLTQTELWNLDAGYGTDDNGNDTYDGTDVKGKVPVLIGAKAQGEAGWDDLSDPVNGAFPILLGDQTEPLAITTVTIVECLDNDGDGLCNNVETNSGTYVDADHTGTDPNNDDTDGDGLNDGDEVNTYGTDPTKADSDGDGYDDAEDANPLTADAPGGTGYDAATDSRTYNISGSITYDGSKTDTLYVKVYDDAAMTSESEIASTSFATPSYPQAYYFTGLAPKATYYLLAFIDVDTNGAADASEPSGFTEVAIALDMFGKDIELPMESTQIVHITPENRNAVLGGSFTLTVDYDVSDGDKTLSSLGFRVHFDSSKLQYNGFSDFFPTSKLGDPQLQDDTEDKDGDADTDKLIVIGYTDPINMLWPGESQSLPLDLVKLLFNVQETATLGETQVNVTKVTVHAGYEFSGSGSTINIVEFNLDVDGNGVADGGTDGIVLIRYLFEFRDAALTNEAVAPDATRSSAADIQTYLSNNIDLLDVDGNGVADGGTDGIILIRYLFEFRDAALTNEAVAPDATRSSAVDIQNYLDSLMP